MSHVSEQAFYDAQAAILDPAKLPPRPPDEYERHLLDQLGPVDELRVLDVGCGAGDLTLELLARGADVTALDLSPAMVQLAAERAALHRPRARARFTPAAIETMPYPDASFDRVVGKWIIHHVAVDAAAREVHRVLTPGGRAVFFENQARNPLLSFARRRLVRAPGLTQVGTADEHPLTKADYDALRRMFRRVELSYPNFYCFEALSRALGYRSYNALRGLDARLYRRFPRLRPWSYHVLIAAAR